MPKARKIIRRGPPSQPALAVPAIVSDRLLGDVRTLIEGAREQTARAVNSVLAGLYWHIGKRIREDVLQEKRADYGEAIVSTLSKQLIAEYGRGYSKPNLSRMMWLAEAFPDAEIVSALSKQLSWSHFVEILPLKDPLKRDFYAEMCRRPMRDRRRGARRRIEIENRDNEEPIHEGRSARAASSLRYVTSLCYETRGEFHPNPLELR
jgi:hypothetical protein